MYNGAALGPARRRKGVGCRRCSGGETASQCWNRRRRRRWGSGVLNASVGAVRTAAQRCRGAGGGCRRRAGRQGGCSSWRGRRAWRRCRRCRRSASARRASRALLVSSCSSRWGRSPCGKAPCSSNAAGGSRRAETAEERRVDGRPQSLRMAARARAACGDGLHCAGRARAVVVVEGMGGASDAARLQAPSLQALS